MVLLYATATVSAISAGSASSSDARKLHIDALAVDGNAKSLFMT